MCIRDSYYTLETAIAAVNVKYRHKGRCITYEAAQGRWETKQFTGTRVESWEQALSLIHISRKGCCRWEACYPSSL